MPGTIAEAELQRKLVHMASSILPLGYWLLGRELALIVLACMTIFMALAEFLRLYTPFGRRLYQRFFGSMTRAEEFGRVTGATYVLVGMLLAALLFKPVVAIVAMLFLSMGDSTAAVVGQRYGRIALGGKTLEGTLACLAVCLGIALLVKLSWPVAVGGALVAALVEVVPWRWVNDNLTIPVLAGGAMTLLMVAGL